MGRRFAHLQWLKLIGITAFMWLFFIGYFHVLRHPVHAVTTMPVTALDALVPFQPWTLGAYLSLWFYVGLAPGLQLTVAQLRVYAVWSISLCVTGLAIFYVWPTAVPPVELAGPHSGAFQMLRGMDASGNACPSLHVAFAVFTGVWFERILRRMGTGRPARMINWLWCLGIVYSTIATLQHVFLDALAGTILGAIVAWMHLRWLRKLPAPIRVGGGSRK